MITEAHTDPHAERKPSFAVHGCRRSCPKRTRQGPRLPSVPGGTYCGGGVTVGARDLDRLGHLMLCGGTHQGRALLPADGVHRIGQPGEIAPF